METASCRIVLYSFVVEQRHIICGISDGVPARMPVTPLVGLRFIGWIPGQVMVNDIAQDIFTILMDHFGSRGVEILSSLVKLEGLARYVMPS